MKLELNREDVCSLLIGCTLLSKFNDSSFKWNELHDKIKEQLADHDRKKLEEQL